MLYPPTGTYEDILALFAREDLKRSSAHLPSKPDWARAAAEPVFHSIAKLLLVLARLTPADRMLAVQDRVYRGLSGGPERSFDESSPELARAARLIKELEAQGRPPALACLFSHPPVTSEFRHLNLELLRAALRGLRLARGRPCRPSLVIAVDRFALDTLPLHHEGLYACFMGQYHLGTDRLISARAPLQRALLAPSAWRTIATRTTRLLAAGGEMTMALSGGVPATGRVLYCEREFLWRLRRSRPAGLHAAAVRALLRAEAPSFAAFEASEEVGSVLKRSLWRLLEAWLVYETVAEGGMAEVDAGRLSARGRATAAACARALGAPPEAVAGLEEEFAREVPYRERFFRLLAARVVAKGRAVVLLPLTHGRPGAIRIDFGPPAALVGASRASGGWRVKVRGQGFAPEEVPLERFARDFVRPRYD